MNKTFNGHTPKVNGLLNLDCSDTHIHNSEAKRCKVNNDSATYMWHCRLGHIGVKRMKKLHADGILESLDYESLDACEPCLMGKMTKTPFPGTMERATDCWESQHNLKFSYAHQDASMEYTSNEGKGVHLHTLVDRERKRSNEHG